MPLLHELDGLDRESSNQYRATVIEARSLNAEADDLVQATNETGEIRADEKR